MGQSVRNCGSTWQCFKVGTNLALCLIALLTALSLLIYTFGMAYFRRVPVRKWGIVMLCMGFLEVFFLSLHYAFLKNVAWTFVGHYFESLQFTYLTYVFARHACNMFKKKELIGRVLIPFFSIVTVFLSILFLYIFIAALLNDIDPDDCRDVHWILNSAVSFGLALLFMLLGLFILNRLARVRMAAPLRARKKKQLWSLMLIYFGSAFTSFAYDCVSFSLSNATECDNFFGEDAANAIFVVIVRFVGLLLPVFGICMFEFMSVHKPLKKRTYNHAFQGHLPSGTFPNGRVPLMQSSGPVDDGTQM
eukprot:ANDGO_05235.mRNA.1 hypothetical protein ACA1_046410